MEKIRPSQNWRESIDTTEKKEVFTSEILDPILGLTRGSTSNRWQTARREGGERSRAARGAFEETPASKFRAERLNF